MPLIRLNPLHKIFTVIKFAALLIPICWDIHGIDSYGLLLLVFVIAHSNSKPYKIVDDDDEQSKGQKG